MRPLPCAIALAMLLVTSAAAEESTPEQQVEALLRVGLAHAKDMLEGGQEFDPYAYVARSNGSTARIEGADEYADPNLTGPGGGEIGPEKALERIVQKLTSEQRKAADLVTIGIFVDTDIKLPKLGETSAVQARMEHESGFCTDVYYPYSRLVEDELVFGHPVSTHNDGAVFGNCK
jgi:hypothetical protein